jgi:hypothetical protein
VLLAAALALGLIAPAPAAADPPIVTIGTRAFYMKDDNVPPINLNKRKVGFFARTKFDPQEHWVVAPLPGTEGDPTPNGATGGGAVLTVYNTSGSGEQVTVVLPAEKWHFQGDPAKSFRYIYVDDPSIAPIWRIWIKTHKITIRGGKAAWGYTLDEPSQGRIAMRLTLGTGVTWCAEAGPQFSGNPPSTAKYDRVDKWKARAKTPAPAICPDLP